MNNKSCSTPDAKLRARLSEATKAMRLLRKHKLPQRKLAELVGVTQGLIGHYLRGRRLPTLATAAKIIKALSAVETKP